MTQALIQCHVRQEVGYESIVADSELDRLYRRLSKDIRCPSGFLSTILTKTSSLIPNIQSPTSSRYTSSLPGAV